jgi:hypothetical protein
MIVYESLFVFHNVYVSTRSPETNCRVRNHGVHTVLLHCHETLTSLRSGGKRIVFGDSARASTPLEIANQTVAASAHIEARETAIENLFILTLLGQNTAAGIAA